MSKGELYKINDKKINNEKDTTLSFLVGLVVYACVLLIASNLFRNLYVMDFMHAVVAALILSILNSTIKPVLVFLTLPLSILTLGIAYPVVNMIILKLCDLLMGSSFEIHGFISMFFIAIFISFLKIVLDKIITKRFGGR